MTSKSQKKRDLILDAAMKKMCQNGYAKTTLDDIAKEVGLTQTALYYYFKSKEDLVTRLSDRFILQISQRQRAILSQDKPLVDRLLELIDYRTEYSREIMANYANFTEDVLLVVPFLRDRIMAAKNASVVILTEEIFREEAKGGIAKVDPPAFALLFDNLLHAIDLRLYTQGAGFKITVSEEAIIAQMKTMVRKALTPVLK